MMRGSSSSALLYRPTGNPSPAQGRGYLHLRVGGHKTRCPSRNLLRIACCKT